MKSGARNGVKGFTIIELIISAAIGSIILVSAYLALRAGIEGQKMIDSRADAIQSARVALEIMTADLRSATPLYTEFEFLGRKRTVEGATISNLDFATHNYTPLALREGDFCEISYFMETNKLTGKMSLWRRRDTSPDEEPLMGGTREEIAQNLIRFKLEYYDGYEWFDTWGDPTGEYTGRDTAYLPSNVYGTPEAVAIILEFPAEEERDSTLDVDEESAGPATLTFETVVRLDLAPVSYTAGESGGSGEQPSEEGYPAP